MSADEFDAQVTSVAALGEPVRRELYRYVVSQDGPVGREEAAASVGVAHHVAKFHLDKLESDGLLETEYRRPPGRSGPGAGRPAKLYRRSARVISVSLPDRRYDIAGRVMAEAITAAERDGIPVADAVRDAARGMGRALGERARNAAENPPGGDAVGELSAVLADNGYEPRVTPGGVTLANCPFHRLAESYTDLVCTMNLDLIGGVLEALGPTKLAAHLAPAPGRCCVTVTSD